MKLLLTALILGLLVSVGALYLMAVRSLEKNRLQVHRELQEARVFAEAQLAERGAKISGQLQEFARVVAADRDFAMKVLVERDPSSPEVAEFASRYLGPMGFDLLEITDGESTILSCGHFPANAGRQSNAVTSGMEKIPLFATETVKGRKEPTLRAATAFSIAEYPFKAWGGIVVDGSFLNALRAPATNAILLVQGETVTGTIPVQSISETEDRTVTVNGKAYLAETVPLPSARPEDTARLLVLVERPGAPSIRSLF